MPLVVHVPRDLVQHMPGSRMQRWRCEKKYFPFTPALLSIPSSQQVYAVVHLGHSCGAVIPLSPVNQSLQHGTGYGTRCLWAKQAKLLNAEGICSLEKYAKVKKLLEASGELYF